MKALSLCAGLGTRFRPHTDKIAKPALPFFGIPMAAFGLYYLERAGLRKLAINTHHLPNTVQHAMSCMTHEKDYQVTFYNEQPTVLGSGGGIYNARDTLTDPTEPFVVINGDEIILSDTDDLISEMIQDHKSSKALVTFLVTDHPEAGKSLGALRVDQQSHITGLSIKGEGQDLKHNCGVYIYDQRVFEYMPKHKKDFHIFTDCLIPAMKRGEVLKAHQRKDLLWLETSSERNYIQSTHDAIQVFLSKGPRADVLKNILARFHQSYDVILSETGVLLKGQNTKVGQGVKVNGFALLSPNSQVDQGVLENSVIGIGLHCHEMLSLKNQLLISN